jgi:hypothetical protein
LLEGVLQQRQDEKSTLEESFAALASVMGGATEAT